MANADLRATACTVTVTVLTDPDSDNSQHQLECSGTGWCRCMYIGKCGTSLTSRTCEQRACAH